MKRFLKDEVTRKVVLFFHENPHSIDTPRGIALWTGCGVEEVKRALKKLNKKGILVLHSSAYTEAYSYTVDKGLIKKIEKALKPFRH